MKRLRAYIISLLALLTWATDSWGCGIWQCPPGEYLLYRVADPAIAGKRSLNIQPLAESDDPEVKRYLEIARSCEKIRQEYDSKWYYPAKGHDVVVSSLEEVLSESLAYNGTRLRDRYALQAARAMFTLGRFRQMIGWWEEIKGQIKDQAIRNSIEGYVAGALFRSGEEARALKYYTEIDDIQSLIFCLKKMGRYEGTRSVLEYAAVNCPDSPDVVTILQEYVTRMEVYGDFKERGGDAEACYNMCMKAAGCSMKPAMWLYTAAFMKNQMGQPHVASDILARAERCGASTFLKESIKVLRIIIDAQTSSYGQAYESKLLEDLIWLDNKIRNNITKYVREETSRIYSLKFCYSYYYWNDMMRRLLLGTVCPRMAEAGKTPLALLLANYADNRLMMSVNQVEVYNSEGRDVMVSLDEYRRDTKNFNQFDFSNHYFGLLDKTPVDCLVQYESLLMNPASALEKFLQKRSYVDQDYLKDIIGTRYIREQKYSEAARYLSQVTEGYESRLNTSAYMYFNPFEIKAHCLRKSKSYKLDFVRKMIDYEHIVNNCTDDDIRGEAMIRIGLGMRASYMSCWALTYYSKSVYDPWYEDKATHDLIAEANSMIEKGLKTLKDPELSARYYRDLCQWRTAVEKFPETRVAQEIRTSCDNIVNYSCHPDTMIW